MTLFENNRLLLAFMSSLLLVSCSYLPDQLDPIDWVDSANDWVKAGIWGNGSSDPDPNAPRAREAVLSAVGFREISRLPQWVGAAKDERTFVEVGADVGVWAKG